MAQAPHRRFLPPDLLRCLIAGLMMALTAAFQACAQPAAQARSAGPIKLSTWNLNWLTLRPEGSPGLPADIKPRSREDFDRLRAYARELDADVVALQEVDSYDAVRLVFPADTHVLHLTHDRLTQKVGVAIRRGLRHDVHADVPLNADPSVPLRTGLDVSLTVSALRLLIVHLKHGCREPKLDRAGGRDCALFHGQNDLLRAWIAARAQAGTPFMVLGDFNRWMDRRDPFLENLRRAAPLVRATEGFANPCWDRAAFIDHILIGGPAATWLVPGSLIVLRYRETGNEWKSRLSDHCPVSVRVRVEDGAFGQQRDVAR